ncbi:hypothetical protein BGZ70_007297 [Mortierella alpina]|uniref:Centromere protein Chl4/mis15/CENP-N n=1 Tax=Mortierella alpina TaxID=64518 RepID=A0A9P6M343_MORAP|nr:hypothetical protein BGZ70_007297 [Mortierella alpina]
MDTNLFPDTPALRRVLSHHSREDLLNLAIQWTSRHSIIRHDESEYADENYLEFMIDLDDRPETTRHLTSQEYQKHVAERYEAMREKATKKSIVERILGFDWSTGLSSSQIAELDLQYYSRNPNLKTWRALKLDYGEQDVVVQSNVGPSKIEKTLAHYLGPYFKHHIQTLQDKDMIWIRICIHDGLAPNVLPVPASVVYLIWFTNSEYLLSSTIKAEWRDFIMEALLRLFKASEVVEWPLTGKSPTSLAALLLQKESQGAFSRYRLNQLDDNPLSTAPKKRKAEDSLQKYAKGEHDICAEDMSRIASRNRTVASEFGPNAQPSLSRVDIQLNLPYTNKAKDFELGRLNRQVFPMKVIFEGPNVIEGLKSLIPLGMTDPAGMPKFLTELHSMATNSLTVDVDENDASNEKYRVTTG